MEMTELLNAITTVGFPIVMCVVLAYYVKYTTDKNNERVDAQNLRHAEEVKGMTEALENNTKVLERICTKLDVKGGENE